MTDWNSLYSNQGIRIQGNPALGQLEQGIAERKKQQAVDNANYTNEIAKLNFGGARDADLPQLNQQYNAVLGKFGELRNTTDQNKRAQLALELKQGQNSFLQSIEHSKNANQQYMNMAHLPFQPNANLQDGAQQKILGLNKVSSFDPEWQQQYSTVADNLFQPKAVDWNKETSGLFKGLLDKSTNSTFVKDPTTGKLVNQRTVSSDVDKDAYKASLATMLKDPTKLKSAIRDYGAIDAKDAVQKIYDATYDPYSKHLGSDVTSGNPIETDADRMRMHAANRSYDIAHPLKDPAVVTPTYFQDLSERMRNGVAGSGEEFSKYLEANPNYHKGLGIDASSPNKVTITVPSKMKEVQLKENGVNTGVQRVVDIPSYKVTLDKKDPQQWTAAFARLYKDVTGDNSATPPKAMTVGGKGHVAGGTQSQPENTSYGNITQAKDSKGNTITLGYKNGKWYDTKTNKAVE